MRWILGLTALAGISMGLMGTSLAAAEVVGAPLTVRVYDAAGVSKAALATALDVAADALGPAKVDVTWIRCEASGPARCGRPLAGAEVIVRLVRLPASSGPATDEALGTALVDPGTGTGVLATVYIDRVERLAHAGGSDLGTLVGRAMAHEIGHLLLGRTTHGAHGLMRPRWTRAEVARNAAADWGFAAPELSAIRARRDRF
jgi:hypothetical protein